MIIGHDAGDAVLQNVSSLLKSNLRKYDVVWRWGGEEFLIMLPETDSNKANSIANKLRSLIEESAFDYRRNNIHVTMSFGVSEILKTEKVNEFLVRLDALLYKAKNQGRNIVVFD